MIFTHSINDIEFTELTPENIGEIIGYFNLRDNRSCESSPLCLYLYRHQFRPYFYKTEKGCLIIFNQGKDKYGNTVYDGAVPYCKDEDLPEMFFLQEKYFNEVLNVPQRIVSADSYGTDILKKNGCFENYTVEEAEELKDYLYDGETMRTLKGKKLNKKRNLINQFNKKYDGRWQYVKLGFEDKSEVLSFLNDWYIKHGEAGEESLNAEWQGIKDIFENENMFDYFRFGGIKIDGELKAFSMGAYNERIKTAVIDVEKADKDITGLYQLINREFLINEFPGAEIVNREDDAGEENLRKAKLSYYPVDFERKYTIYQKTRIE